MDKLTCPGSTVSWFCREHAAAHNTLIFLTGRGWYAAFPTENFPLYGQRRVAMATAAFFSSHSVSDPVMACHATSPTRALISGPSRTESAHHYRGFKATSVSEVFGE